MRIPSLVSALVLTALTACAEAPEPEAAPEAAGPFAPTAGTPLALDPREGHLRNLRQLTFEGENAEAYFSPDGRRLVFQRKPASGGCDQIFTLDLATGDTARVSGGGRTTCGYFYPTGDRIIFASTHLADMACPADPDFSRGYVWPIFSTYELFVADLNGENVQQLTDVEGYDAEATVSPNGDRVIFTSTRDGDLELYTMALDGSDVRRITNRLGYDGGAFFSPDGSKIVWRAQYPETTEEQADYRALLAEDLVRPSVLEIWVANADGSDARQITSDGVANFAPYFHPSGEKILFSSNMDDPSGRDFDLYMINLDGTGLERLTYATGFDGFPMFSPDGRYLVFGSNRKESHPGNTNVFIAEWVEEGGAPAP
jgi:TolB protein